MKIHSSQNAVSYEVRSVIPLEHQAYEDLFKRTAEEMNVRPEEINRRIDQLLTQARSRGGVFLAAWGGRDEDKMIGFVMLKPEDEGKKISSRHVAQMRVTVDPKFQGDGIGTGLVKFALDQARTTGYLRRIEVLNYETSIDDRHWFEKLGFEVEGRMRNRIRNQDGKLIDAYMMAYII